MWYLYGILAIAVIYIGLCAFIRLKFRFWSMQPVFHIYDILYWLRPPGIIMDELPEMNKYVNIVDIKTYEVSKMDNSLSEEACKFIKSNYLRNANAQYLPTVSNIIEYLRASNHPSYFTLYKVPSRFPDAGYKAVISARVLHVTLGNNKPFPTYYVDNLCVHPEHRKQGVAPKAIQTHVYNLRRNNKKVKTCLFKREGNLTAIIPLTAYPTYGYHIRDIPVKALPHAAYQILDITPKNLYLLTEFIYAETKEFDCVVLPEVTNISNLLKTENILIYGINYKGKLVAAYVFRDAALQYGKDKTVECIGSLATKKEAGILYSGFTQALCKCKEKLAAGRLLLEETAHNINIVGVAAWRAVLS